MDIYEALKEKSKSLRVVNSYDNKWLLWDEDENNWKVYEKKPYARTTTLLYSGDSCDKAISFLVY